HRERVHQSWTRGSNGGDDALLSTRPAGHHQNGRETVVLARRRGACLVAMVSRELSSERSRMNGAPIELEEEPVLTASQAQQAIAIRSNSAPGARSCIAPFQ